MLLIRKFVHRIKSNTWWPILENSLNLNQKIVILTFSSFYTFSSELEFRHSDSEISGPHTEVDKAGKNMKKTGVHLLKPDLSTVLVNFVNRFSEFCHKI